MKTKNLYSIINTRIFLLFGITAALLMLSGCGQKEVEVAKLEPEEAFANIPHSHEATEEKCFICDPSQREKGRLWCTEHARYEDRCWLCHPELEDKSRLWCKEHSLYEDECFLCHPELKSGAESKEKIAPIEGALNSFKKSQLLFCNEHNVAELECGICQPDLAASLLPGGNMKVRFPSLASADKVGIQTDFPEMSQAAPTIKAFCEAQYNLNTMAKVTPLVGGVIRDVMHDLGDEVIAGEVLLELHSAEVASAKSDYLSALVDLDIRRQAFDRESRLSKQNIAAEKDFLEAEANYRTAKFSVSKLKQKLTNFGLNEKEVAEVESEQDTSAQLVIRAPFDGTLVERGAVRGEAVEMGQALFTIADLSTNWLTLSIPSDHIGQVGVGQTVAARFPELPGTTIRGRITWLDTSIDSRSRMVRARAVVTEDAHLIKSGLFGDALITAGEARPAAFVPKNAVQRHEGNDFVFVREEPDLFALRRVALGNSRDGNVEVLLGLNSSDSVVTGGSFIVMSEFLKSRLGAGCVDE